LLNVGKTRGTNAERWEACKKKAAAKATASSQSFMKLLVTASAATVAPATAAATVTAATTTVATTSTSAATVAATTAATAWWACLAWTSFVDRERPAFNGLAVEFRDRRLRISFRGHGDKGEATGLAGEFVLHERYLLDCASLREKLLQFVFGRIEREIAYV
jgi:hypothetical protein